MNISLEERYIANKRKRAALFVLEQIIKDLGFSELTHCLPSWVKIANSIKIEK